MKYRKLGRSSETVSVLGFGCMRLPIMDGTQDGADIFNPEKIVDEKETTEMVEYAVDHGINYFDTAYGYHTGQSEIILGRAIRSSRDDVLIASKMPVWLIKSKDDFDRILDEQLVRLNTDRLDYYLLHGLGRHSWEPVRRLGALEFMARVVDEGRVRHIGFSFHDDIKIFKEIMDAHDWEMCQIQYNFYDEDYQAGREGLEYAAAKGIGVVAMEPLRGGKLVDRIPDEVRYVWESAPRQKSPVEWAFRWVWDQPEVAMTLSGMSSMKQLIENIDLAGEAEPGYLTEEERGTIARARDAYRRMMKVDCTTCAYCMPCPSGVNIPANLSMYNDTFMFKDPEINVMMYNHMLLPEQRASNCIECGRCEELCPQHIRVIEELKKVHEVLGKE